MFFLGLRDSLDKASYFPAMPGILFIYFYELRKVAMFLFTVHLKGQCHDIGEKLASVIDTCDKLTLLKVFCKMLISRAVVSDTAAKSWSPVSLSTAIFCHRYGMVGTDHQIAFCQPCQKQQENFGKLKKLPRISGLRKFFSLSL
jgi:hypothetical protein